MDCIWASIHHSLANALDTKFTGVDGMPEEKPGYLAFMLRLWQTKTNGESCWRASLEQVDSGERIGFICLADLVRYLEQLTEAPSDHETKPNC
jgi:hypothetical protein